MMFEDDIVDKLEVLLDYWIKHNTKHEEEFRSWADRVNRFCGEAAQQLQDAAVKMAAVSSDLAKARQCLLKSKGRH